MSQHERWQGITSIAVIGAVADEADLRKRFGDQQFVPQGGFVLRQGQ